MADKTEHSMSRTRSGLQLGHHVLQVVIRSRSFDTMPDRSRSERGPAIVLSSEIAVGVHLRNGILVFDHGLNAETAVQSFVRTQETDDYQWETRPQAGMQSQTEKSW